MPRGMSVTARIAAACCSSHHNYVSYSDTHNEENGRSQKDGVRGWFIDSFYNEGYLVIRVQNDLFALLVGAVL